MIGNAQKERKRGRFESALKEIAGSFIKNEIGSSAVVTITRVEMLEDLSFTKIFLSVFPESGETRIVEKLNANRKYFNEILLKKLKMRFIPAVFFEIDTQPALERRVEELLHQK